MLGLYRNRKISFFLCVLFGGCILVPTSMAATADRPATKVDKILQAITDEIYFYSFELQAPLAAEQNKVPVYIELREAEGFCRVIYRFYPHGEVIRRFVFGPDALITLIGHGRMGFKSGFPRDPSVGLTIQIPDDELIRYKESWLRDYYSLEASLEKTEIITRQARRLEFIRINHLYPGIYKPSPGCGIKN